MFGKPQVRTSTQRNVFGRLVTVEDKNLGLNFWKHHAGYSVFCRIFKGTVSRDYSPPFFVKEILLVLQGILVVNDISNAKRQIFVGYLYFCLMKSVTYCLVFTDYCFKENKKLLKLKLLSCWYYWYWQSMNCWCQWHHWSMHYWYPWRWRGLLSFLGLSLVSQRWHRYCMFR